MLRSPAIEDPAIPIAVSTSSPSRIFLTLQNRSSFVAYPLTAVVDQLSPEQVSIVSKNASGTHLNLEVLINGSFKNDVLKIISSKGRLRLLQEGPIIIAEIPIQRWDSIQEEDHRAMAVLKVIFKVFSWVALISIILLMLLGIGVVCEEYIINLVLLNFFSFVGRSSLPLSLIYPLSGLHRILSLNFLAPSVDENFLAETFFDQIQPILFINIFYALWWLLMFGLRKKLFKKT